MSHKISLLKQLGHFSPQERKKIFNAFRRAETKEKSSINLAGSKYKIKKVG